MKVLCKCVDVGAQRDGCLGYVSSGTPQIPLCKADSDITQRTQQKGKRPGKIEQHCDCLRVLSGGRGGGDVCW